MKIETLKERIEKKEAQIAKKSNTIKKKENLIFKKENKASRAWAKDDTFEQRSLEIEISMLREDIKRLNREIAECEATLEKYRAQLAGEIEKEAQFIKEVPEQVKDMEKALIVNWTVADVRRQSFLREEYKELGYREFFSKYSGADFDLMHKTSDEIQQKNIRDARTFVLDLLNRTKDITGEVTSWEDIRLEIGTNGFPVLNGYVEGKEGRAEVESILAGGYNIQRLHVRVLVKAC